MTIRVLARACATTWLLGGAASTAATAATISGLSAPSAFALPFRPVVPAAEGPLAQRTITREWGLSEDSTYGEVDVPGLKSEGLAAMLSAVAPGTGQYYLGESSSWWFALAEAASWTSWSIFRHEARDYRVLAARAAGAPNDPSSAWSFARWASQTQNDPAEVQALYTADPEAFYRALADDPRYQVGWADPAARDEFARLRARADRRSSGARFATTVLWVNHLIAGVDALRAARLNNFPLRSNLRVRVNGRVSQGRPGFAFAIERSF